MYLDARDPVTRWARLTAVGLLLWACSSSSGEKMRALKAVTKDCVKEGTNTGPGQSILMGHGAFPTNGLPLHPRLVKTTGLPIGAGRH